MPFTRSTLVSVIAVAAVLAAPPVRAQDVQYETVTRVDLPGAAGTMLRVASRLGGGAAETVEKTTIKGSKMRTDVGKASTILDLDAKRFISIDHASKTYSVLTFDELVRNAKQAADAALKDARQTSGNQKAETQVKFRFSVDPANERQRVAGFEAERFFLTMEAEGEYVPEGSSQMEEGGTLVVLTDMWASKDVPAFQARSAFDKASARQYAEAGAALTKGLAAAFADDPKMKVAFEQSISEARKIEGMPVRSVVSFIGVPPGQRFDRALVTQPKQGGASAAQQAGRAALGRLGSRIAGAAGRQQNQDTPAAQEAKQTTVMSVTSEIRNVSTSAVDAKLFEPPAGYREVKD